MLLWPKNYNLIYLVASSSLRKTINNSGHALFHQQLFVTKVTKDVKQTAF
jgi:hypothetical protein